MRSYNVIVSPYQKNTVDTQFYFKQNDYGIPISITVEDYDTSGTTAKIVFRRADEVTREYNIVKSSDGTYKYNLSADEIYYPGKVFVDLKFYKDGVRESTASFIYHVITDKVGETFASGDYSDSIARAIESYNQAIANIQEQANQAIEDVENALLAELNIYDGYDKTTIGFAADARQLNENVVNSFASKVKEKIDSNTNLINALNNNLTAKIAMNDFVNGTSHANANTLISVARYTGAGIANDLSNFPSEVAGSSAIQYELIMVNIVGNVYKQELLTWDSTIIKKFVRIVVINSPNDVGYSGWQKIAM